MIPNNLLTAASFTPSSLQSPNAWVGHLPFATWVIQEVSPKIFVELGTHSGNSYFTFCQSVVEAGISTKCYAVDTWQGDEHAGQYNDEIFAKVNAHHQERYAAISHLLRMTFDEAVTYFADESIELLHIDGLHTYEAVKHDFETWLPKLAPGAIVMFHDTNVYERNFGVWKLWKELQAIYPNNLEFIHSHGLGVLQLDKAPENKKHIWFQPNSPGKKQLINYFAALGARTYERYELTESKAHIALQANELHAYQSQADEFAEQVSSLQDELHSAQAHIALQANELHAYQSQADEFAEQVSSLQDELHSAQAHSAQAHIALQSLRTQRAEELASARFLSRQFVALIFNKLQSIFTRKRV